MLDKYEQMFYSLLNPLVSAQAPGSFHTIEEAWRRIMLQTPAGEVILTDRDLAICLPLDGRSSLPTRGFCPFHDGSTGSDLTVDRFYGRFSCIVCGKTGWTEEGWMRWQEGSRT